MPPGTLAASQHTPADLEYLDSLSARQLMEFRNHLFHPRYIESNAAKFLDNAWIDITLLREFLGHPPDASTTRESKHSPADQEYLDGLSARWLMDFRNHSLIPAEVWDRTPSTTNTNEGQHHWTNSLTGIKLTPVEAVESRRKVDTNTADEIKLSLQTGILANNNNDMSHRMARNAQRQSATARMAGRDIKEVKPALPIQSDAPVAPLSTAVAVAESTQPDQNSAEFTASAAFNVDFFANASRQLGYFRCRDFLPAIDVNLPVFDPTMFEFDFSIPTADPPADPLDEFMNSFGSWDVPGGFGAFPDAVPASATAPPLETLPIPATTTRHTTEIPSGGRATYFSRLACSEVPPPQ
ncbi:hypothetical protein C8R45DRAFT_938618 [Mycena sanguinolenta]|nr:hypothetical protein C8R45DRAFT_938618 [Mycena sanguinolenta]